MEKFIKWLEDKSACEDAIEYVRHEKTFREVWHNCVRGDYLLWFCARLKIKRELVVLAACGCAETALQYVPFGEKRPKVAIETARAWCRGEATLDEVKEAAGAAADAATVAYAVAALAPDAAHDAALAAHAAALAALTAHAAVVAALAAAEVAYSAASVAARAAASKEHAEIVRGIIKYEIVEAEMKQRGLFY